MYHTWHIYICMCMNIHGTYIYMCMIICPKVTGNILNVADFGKPCMSILAASQFTVQLAQTAPLLRSSRRAT